MLTTSGPFHPIPGTQIVGVTGKSRHGKDTFAAALIDAVSGAERFAVSDIISAHERLSGRMVARDPVHLQNCFGQFPREWLVAAMYHAIVDRRPKLAVITGVRKPDEAAMIHATGGTIVRVYRPGFETTDRDPSHPVEQDIDHLEADLLFASPDVITLQQLARAFARTHFDHLFRRSVGVPA